MSAALYFRHNNAFLASMIIPPMPVHIACMTGLNISPWLEAVARLRIDVFRDYPYLYDGSLDYEREYLATYATSTNSLFVLAMQDSKVVGASTAIALTDAEPAFQTPFLQHGIPLADVLYFGESVLDPAYRGHGIGHRFFDERERFAQQQGKRITAFCAVERPEDHPRKPAHYTPLDAFWQQRGYQRRPDMRTHYEWLDIDTPTATHKPMVFWLREELQT